MDEEFSILWWLTLSSVIHSRRRFCSVLLSRCVFSQLLIAVRFSVLLTHVDLRTGNNTFVNSSGVFPQKLSTFSVGVSFIVRWQLIRSRLIRRFILWCTFLRRVEDYPRLWLGRAFPTWLLSVQFLCLVMEQDIAIGALYMAVLAVDVSLNYCIVSFCVCLRQLNDVILTLRVILIA